LKVGIVAPVSGGIIEAVASPAQAHRALICASLSDAETYIECNETPDDLYTTIKSLNEQGAKIRYDGSGFEVIPIEIPSVERESVENGAQKKREYKLSGDKAYQSLNGLLLTLPLQSTDSTVKVEGKEEQYHLLEIIA